MCGCECVSERERESVWGVQWGGVSVLNSTFTCTLYRHTATHTPHHICNPPTSNTPPLSNPPQKKQVRDNLLARAREFNIIVDDVAITHLSFGTEFTKAVEAKQVAQQEAERARFVVMKADQERKAAIIRAEGESEAAKLISEATKAVGGGLSLQRFFVGWWWLCFAMMLLVLCISQAPLSFGGRPAPCSTPCCTPCYTPYSTPTLIPHPRHTHHPPTQNHTKPVTPITHNPITPHHPTQVGSALIELRRIEAAKEIAGTLSRSRNVVYLPNGNNMLIGLNPGQPGQP